MKALLRSALVALVVFAAYAAFATSGKAYANVGPSPRPNQIPCSPCAK